MPKEFILKHVKFDNHLFLNICKMFTHYAGTCILYSGGSYDSSRRSFLCLFPYETLWINGPTLWKESPLTYRHSQRLICNPWDALRETLSFSHLESDLPEWLGFFSYELGAFSDLNKQGILHSHSQFPQAYFQKCALILAVDHESGIGKVRVMDHGLYLLEEEEKEWVQRLSNESKWEDFASNLKSLEEDLSFSSPLHFAKPMEEYEAYKKKVEIAQELIHAGDIYQVNLSHQLSLSGKRDPYQVFRKLAQINPAPFSAYMHLKNYTIVSSSPERFLRKQGEWLETRPIKGTIPRGKTPEEDRKNLEVLLNSAKENAELLMITDLMRHDLGKVSVSGSVEVKEIRSCEAYQNVYHLLSIIKSRALPGLSPLDILRACFPGGSITGCPKLSAMDVIAKLEKRPRDIYTGSIGYFTGQGDFDFNIAIRTLLMTDQHIDIQLGGAIVADSQPDKEYNETLQKGASIFKALHLDCLNNTLRFDQD
jgi:para-aminobenzoate synthetase component I